MKLLTHLEKRFEVWALLFISFIFFLLRLPSLFEPYWYGDEGIYHAIGDSMRSGNILYSEIWDNKPPLLYIIYAVFGSDQFAIRLFSLITGLLTVILFYFLAKRIFTNEKLTLLTTSLFAFFYGIPLLEGNIANAENFILFFVLFAANIIYRHAAGIHEKKKETFLPFIRPPYTLFVAGVLIGTAFLIKIVAVFDLFAFVFFLLLLHMVDKKIMQIPYAFLTQLKYILSGFFFPFSVAIFYFLFNDALGEFITAVFFSNVDYVNFGNNFFIPQGFLLLKSLLLIGILLLISRVRKKISLPELFILIWFIFAVFNAFFSQRPYTHYMLVVLPSYVLLFGLLFTKTPMKKLYALILIGITFIAVSYFNFFPLKKTMDYYGNFVQFMTGQKKLPEYQSFFDSQTPRIYDVAYYLKSHLDPQDQIFIWGNAAQIYTLSQTVPVGRYTVAYHIINRDDAITETNKAIIEKKPKYIVIYPNVGSVDISLSDYAYKVSIHEANIYERIY